MELPKISQYLSYWRRQSYPELFGDDTLRQMENIELCYGSLMTEETILEICLSDAQKSCDYSFRIDTDSASVREYWYELDALSCQSEKIAPCYFIDASSFGRGKDNRAFYEKALMRLARETTVQNLIPMLERCAFLLPGSDASFYQIGTMAGRGQDNSLRLFTQDLKREELLSYLKALDWTGDVCALDKELRTLEPFSDRSMFILDFDVFEDHISEKIGINFGTRRKNEKTITAFLTFLEERGLCRAEKKRDVLRFIAAYPAHTPFIQNDISHFKLPFLGGRVTMAKAYLRQGNKLLIPDFPAYDSPVLMNLELTSRCPLRCPQCYCDLNKGIDLPLNKALYWIREAARSRVKTVNLSGGETMCYPDLYRLVQECRDLGLQANIAISGWGIDRNSIRQLWDAGIWNICVSLNGSTREINEKTRDGYELAVRTLELLDEMKFPRTTINWVMHSWNADDFPGMLTLAQRYHVQSLAVMMFKPDASHQLPSIPSQQQMRQVAQQIKTYKGPVHIDVEECFSQMRALVNQRFFVNLNQGPQRGCGAGRDGFSVSADGKLTPCRHLELKESWATISEYWKKSPVLRHLRSVEDSPRPPCDRCPLNKNCLPCMAVNWKQSGELCMGDAACPIRP